MAFGVRSVLWLLGLSASSTVTDTRVESPVSDSATLRWRNTTVTSVDIYRSTDGITYTEIESNIAYGTEEFVDSGLVPGTKYWYKLTSDNGILYSEAVTVVTQACRGGSGSTTTFMMPRFDGVSQEADKLNDLAQRVDTLAQEQLIVPEPCFLCINDHALIVDCTDACNTFKVVVTEDINSITIINCGTCPHIEFVVPPGDTVGICGWPSEGSCHHSGDECFEAPVDGGTIGATVYTSGISDQGYGPSGSVEPPSSCNCPPSTVLSIKCCENSCVLECDTNERVKIKACGGLPPYSWSISSGTVTLIDEAGTIATADVGDANAKLLRTTGTMNVAYLAPADCVGGTFHFSITELNPGECTNAWEISTITGGQAPFVYSEVCPVNCTHTVTGGNCPDGLPNFYTDNGDTGWSIGNFLTCSDCGDSPHTMTLRVVDNLGTIVTEAIPNSTTCPPC